MFDPDNNYLKLTQTQNLRAPSHKTLRPIALKKHHKSWASCTSGQLVVNWEFPHPLLRFDDLVKELKELGTHFTSTYWFIIKDVIKDTDKKVHRARSARSQVQEILFYGVGMCHHPGTRMLSSTRTLSKPHHLGSFVTTLGGGGLWWVMRSWVMRVELLQMGSVPL